MEGAAVADHHDDDALAVMNASDNLFSAKSVDYTYSDSYLLQFNPSSQITSRSISFEIPKLSAGRGKKLVLPFSYSPDSCFL